LEPIKERSNWWYLLPIFLGIIGGIAAYFALRKDDGRKADKCIALGIVISAIGLILTASGIDIGSLLFP